MVELADDLGLTGEALDERPMVFGVVGHDLERDVAFALVVARPIDARCAAPAYLFENLVGTEPLAWQIIPAHGGFSLCFRDEPDWRLPSLGARVAALAW